MRSEEEQQLWLLNCLNAILDPSIGTRKAAEDALSKAALEQGYGVALANVTVKSEFPSGLRQLAALLLKQYVKHHWQEGEKDYVPPTVLPQDKERIRSLLPLALGDPEKKIQTAVGMAIASIATCDWPDEWPDLMVYIVGCITDKADVNKVNGAMRCLSLFASEVDDRQLPHLVPVLFPALYDIISSPMVYGSPTRRRALTVLHSCIATLGVMSGTYQSEVKALMTPMLKAWMEQFAAILSSPVRSEDPESWRIKAETLKALLQMVQNFPKLAFAEFSVVVAPLWQTFVLGLQIYEAAAIKGAQETYADLADSDGSDQSLEAFAVQILEFLITLVGHPRYKKVVGRSIKDIAYHTIGYVQMTEEQVQTWSGDPTEFLAGEETLTCSCRTSGVLLLQEIVESYEKDGSLSILEAVSTRIQEAQKAKAQGDTGWWKLREAAILTLGSCVDFEIYEDLPGFSIEDFVNRILVEDLSEEIKLCPFLYGRALWAASKFSSAISKDKRELFLSAATEGISQKLYIPIMVGSCQALSDLLPKVDVSTSQNQLRNIFAALGTMLQEASEETLHIILEALQSAIKADKQHVAEIEPMLSPLLLNIWAKYVLDPLISIDALETIEAVKNVPGCLEPLVARVLPSIARILAQPQSQDPGLVAGALDLLTMLFKNAPEEVLKHAYVATFSSIINILMHTDDHNELQNASSCLAGFVRYGRGNVLNWAADPNAAMKMLLDVAARLLSPETDSSGALFAGSYVVQLIEQLSSHMAPFLRDLVTALVARMQSVNLKGSLIFVLAKLVHMSAPNYGQFIELLVSIPAKNYVNSLACVMSEWTKYHGEIQGSYQIKVSTTALASLLATGHPLLAQIAVEGRLVESGGGIKTRSKARMQPDHWTTVSVPQKIFSLLADAIIEGEETATPYNLDEDDDWDEDDDDDNESEAANKPLSSVFQPLESYEHLLSEESNDEADDPFQSNDPLNQINLQVYLADFMKRFSREAPAAFAELFNSLSDREKAAVQTALKRGEE